MRPSGRRDPADKGAGYRAIDRVLRTGLIAEGNDHMLPGKSISESESHRYDTKSQGHLPGNHCEAAPRLENQASLVASSIYCDLPPCSQGPRMPGTINLSSPEDSSTRYCCDGGLQESLIAPLWIRG